MQKKTLTILGTRPELIKMFTVIKELDGAFNNKLIWSGQHYDYAMVKKNFNDVQLRRPDIQFKINRKKNFFFLNQKYCFQSV